MRGASPGLQSPIDCRALMWRSKPPKPEREQFCATVGWKSVFVGLEVEEDKFPGGLAVLVGFAHMVTDLLDEIAFTGADYSDQTLGQFGELKSLPLVSSQKFLAALAHYTRRLREASARCGATQVGVFRYVG